MVIYYPVAKRGIFDYDTSGEWDENDQYQISEGHEGDLITADDYIGPMNSVMKQLYELSNMPTLETSKLVCANSPDCTLWTIQGPSVQFTS